MAAPVSGHIATVERICKINSFRSFECQLPAYKPNLIWVGRRLAVARKESAMIPRGKRLSSNVFCVVYYCVKTLWPGHSYVKHNVPDFWHQQNTIETCLFHRSQDRKLFGTIQYIYSIEHEMVKFGQLGTISCCGKRYSCQGFLKLLVGPL